MDELHVLFKDYSDFTNAQKLIADYIMTNVRECSYMTLKSFSQTVGVAEITVLKFCRRLGLNGFSELKNVMRNFCMDIDQDIAGGLSTPEHGIDKGNPEEKLHAMCSEEIRNLVETYGQLDTSSMLKFAADIIDVDEVMVFAHNAAFFLAEHLVHKLNILQIKATAVKVNDTESLGAALASLSGKRKRIAVFYSFLYYYAPMKDIQQYCIDKGLKIAVIAGGSDSPLLRSDSYNFIVESKSDKFVNSYTAALSFDNIISYSISLVLGSEYNRVHEEEEKVRRFIKEVQAR